MIPYNLLISCFIYTILVPRVRLYTIIFEKTPPPCAIPYIPLMSCNLILLIIHYHFEKYPLVEWFHTIYQSAISYTSDFSFIIVFHGRISIKRESVIERKRKNGSSLQRHNDAIAEREAVDQPPAETTYTETTQPPQKYQAYNQWRLARGIVSRDKMVQQGGIFRNDSV